MKTKVDKDSWQAAAMHQTPPQLQDHSNGLSEYQMWTGYRVATRQLNLHFASRKEDDNRTKQCKAACANHQAASIPKHRRNQLDGRFQDDTEAATKEWKRIWQIMASVDRNEAVYRYKKISLQECAAQYWVIGTRQLRALAKREHRKAGTAIRGATLLACLELFVQDPRGSPSLSAISHDQPPGTPAIISWLRKFQISCT
ncbi:hypothetical protein GQ600_21916 [Phytophthora cactorum]|nr:hypothetical protein GQ600_21916 [Phytophthora cactorum]